MIAAWPRSRDGQLRLLSGRSGVLQRACSELDAQLASSAAAGSGSMGGALWHGIRVAFDGVGWE